MNAPSGAQVHGHVQGEAFMVMEYRCNPPTQRFGTIERPHCGHSEWIWNSRDGITPYVVGCRFCPGEAHHVNWPRDRYVPDHVPMVGDRIFVDLNAERALQKRRAFVDKWWDEPLLPMRDHPTLGPLGKAGAAMNLAQADVESFAPHTPDLIEVTDAVLVWLEANR